MTVPISPEMPGAAAGQRVLEALRGDTRPKPIVYVLAGTVKQLYYRMMDAVDPTIVDEITSAAKSVNGVLQVHDVRVRWVGRELVAAMHVACNPKSTLEDAHALAMRVEDAVCHEVPAARLEIHMDPGTAKHKHAVVGTPVDEREDEHEHPHDDSRGVAEGHT